MHLKIKIFTLKGRGNREERLSNQIPKESKKKIPLGKTFEHIICKTAVFQEYEKNLKPLLNWFCILNIPNKDKHFRRNIHIINSKNGITDFTLVSFAGFIYYYVQKYIYFFLPFEILGCQKYLSDVLRSLPLIGTPRLKMHPHSCPKKNHFQQKRLWIVEFL